MKDSFSDPVIKKRATHNLVSEIQRTVEAVGTLRLGYIIEEFGKSINSSHIPLLDDYELTGHELNAMAAATWKFDGVIGSRNTGADFGGCTVGLVKEESVKDFCTFVKVEYENGTGLTAKFYIADVGDGTIRLV